MPNILVADEFDVVRVGLKVHLEREKDWRVVGEAADGKEAIRKAIETKPNVVVLPYELPLINGIDATSQIRQQLPDTQVVIYTERNVEQLVAYFLKAGARGIVFKSQPVRHLIAAIRTVIARKPYFKDTVTQRVLEKPSETGLSPSPRERSVVKLIAGGYSNKQVAKALGISLKTVETHRLNVMNKLDLDSFAALVRYAVRNQIIEA